MGKQSINSKMREAQKKMMNTIKDNKEPLKKEPTKKKAKTAKEQYKELRESIKDPIVISSNTYEEDLIKSLFQQDSIKKDENLNNFEESDDKKQEDTIIKHKSGLWDYVLEDEIKFFDPECSYELTGYKPITETKGLDFNPEWFTEAARTYTETGSYTQYPPGSKAYADYWLEQIRRCKEGYESHSYRITGDNYFFINFYRMQTVPHSSTAGKGRIETFPSFHAKQYEFFHYVEMAEKLKKDICALKARGLGFSEIIASLLVRPYTTNKGYISMLTAPDKPKLNNTKNKCWLQLNWLDTNTNGGMRHVRMKINNDDRKRASKVNSENVEYGWMSEIQTIIADSADKIRGSRVDRLVFEESGSNGILTKSWIQSNALVELGGEHFGSRIAIGTAGDDMKLDGLATMFSNPDGYNILPYKNYDTEDLVPIYTSYFIPAHKFALVPEYLDNRGVTDSKRFKEFYENERKKLSGKDLFDYCAEHPFHHQEALFKQGDNYFDSLLIADRLTQLRIQKIGIKPQQVDLLWDIPKGSETNPRNKVKLIPNSQGKVFIYEPPIQDTDGSSYKNLYVAGIDSIDQGTADSSTNNDVSEFCIVIKKRVLGTSPANYVAIYKDRPKDIATAYENAMRLCVYYNCRAMLEHTKISIIMYFRSKKMDKLFMQRPKSTMPDIRKGNSSMIGYPATETYLRHGLELISRFVDESCYNMQIDKMLEQLLKYSWENKRKFDIVAAMIAAELGDEDLLGFTPKVQDTMKNSWKDFGWYYDSYGQKRYGIIP